MPRRPTPTDPSPSARVTMQTVGRMAGVSQVTVSRALSDPDKVSARTLARIRQAIEQTGFVPNALAGALASSRSHLVSALIPSLTNITYTAFIKDFAEQLRGSDYQVLLSETGFVSEDEEAIIERHLSRRPDAILLTGISHSPRARRMLLGAGIPIVEIWDVTESPIDTCVGFSHQRAGEVAANYAADKGYTAAGCVTASDDRAIRRQVHFARSFTARTGVPVADHRLNDQASIAGGREGLARLVDAEGLGRGAIFCSSDIIAQGVLIEAQARGLRVPEDIAVIGFGDQDFAAHLDPALTTIRVDRVAMGLTAAELILSRLAGETPAKRIIDMGFEIVERGSA